MDTTGSARAKMNATCSNSQATPFANFHTEPAYLVPWKKRSVTYPMGYQVANPIR